MIRKYSANVKIVLITAFYADDLYNKADFKEANISNVIQKPVKLAQLRTHVTELCNGC